MIYVTSDLHGCDFSKFKELLKLVKFSDADFLFVLGDVIDRGNDGVEILKWLLTSPNATLILGNHEAMMLACKFAFEEITEESIESIGVQDLRALELWKKNGGDVTLDALRKESAEMRDAIIDYLNDAPLYEVLEISGKKFILTHAGLGNFSQEKDIESYTADELLWNRPLGFVEYSTEYTAVFGHTPTIVFGRDYKGKILKTKTWINIDVGCAMGNSPALLRLDDLAEFYISE